jgi:hypothetical protein
MNTQFCYENKKLVQVQVGKILKHISGKMVVKLGKGRYWLRNVTNGLPWW